MNYIKKISNLLGIPESDPNGGFSATMVFHHMELDFENSTDQEFLEEAWVAYGYILENGVCDEY